MPTYMFQGCYSTAAVAAMVQTPQDRSVAVRELVESLGGKLVGFWLALGEYDFVGIAELADANTVAALSIAASARGSVQRFKSTALLSGIDGMNAFRKASSVKYQPPNKETT